MKQAFRALFDVQEMVAEGGGELKAFFGSVPPTLKVQTAVGQGDQRPASSNTPNSTAPVTSLCRPTGMGSFAACCSDLSQPTSSTTRNAPCRPLRIRRIRT